MGEKADMDPCFTLISGWLIAEGRGYHNVLFIQGYRTHCQVYTDGYGAMVG
jgi:hypothetical protein